MSKHVYLLVYLIGLGLTLGMSGIAVENDKSTKMQGHIVDNFAVEELLASDKSDLTPADATEFDVVWKETFEKGAGLTPPGSNDRHYTNDFPKSRSRFICWEITLDHDPVPHNRDLNLQFQLRKGNEKQLMTGKVNSWIPANRRSTTHSACWGWPYADFWEPGKYMYRLFPEGEQPVDETNLLTSIDFVVKTH